VHALSLVGWFTFNSIQFKSFI